MVCDEKGDLQAKYQKEVQAYVSTVLRLKEHVGAIPHVEFMLLWKAAESIRRNCEVAQRNLEQHVSEHCC